MSTSFLFWCILSQSPAAHPLNDYWVGGMDVARMCVLQGHHGNGTLSYNVDI